MLEKMDKYYVMFIKFFQRLNVSTCGLLASRGSTATQGLAAGQACRQITRYNKRIISTHSYSSNPIANILTAYEQLL